MALDNVTSHFPTMLEPITSASFLSSLSIIHDANDLPLNMLTSHAGEAMTSAISLEYSNDSLQLIILLFLKSNVFFKIM